MLLNELPYAFFYQMKQYCSTVYDSYIPKEDE